MNEQVEAVLRTLPRKIKVGAYDWRIKIDNSDSDDYGMMDPATATITIWPAVHQSPDRVVGTVLHELLHAIFHAQDMYRVEALEEEDVVTGFEEGLICLYRDNPKLLTWIKRGLKST